MNAEELEVELATANSDLDDAKTELTNCEIDLGDVTDERDDLLNKLRILENVLEDLWWSI